MARRAKEEPPIIATSLRTMSPSVAGQVRSGVTVTGRVGRVL